MKTSSQPIDADFVARVAAIVVARLRAMEAAVQASAVPQVTDKPAMDCKLIVASTIEAWPKGSTLFIRSDAVITPLAKDTAKDRDIHLVRQATGKAR